MCDIKGCKNKDHDIIYYNKKVCEKHWALHCLNKINLKELLKIKKEKQTKLR